MTAAENPAPGIHDHILVSCLMVTLGRAERFGFIETSVAAYLAQLHPRKELIVVINGGLAAAQDALVAYLHSLNRSDIKIVQPAGLLTLGQLRNIACEAATGEVICQWDDDDLYHPLRLSAQLNALMEGPYEAAVLQDVMQYVPHLRAMYWTNWHATPCGAHPGTLMARRVVPLSYPESGDTAAKGEDTYVLLQLQQRNLVKTIQAMPHLFIYISHGGNTWDAAHHEMLIARLSISRKLLLKREANIRAGLLAFGFGPDVAIHGHNGLAFKL
ncbi:MAG: glycosyltransferase family A protein [Acidocella sp.]|nr:glycosyltransferase family A protein [Acidocella sp.]